MESVLVLVAGGLVARRYYTEKNNFLSPDVEEVEFITDTPEYEEIVESTPRGSDTVTQEEIEIPVTSSINPPIVNVPALGATGFEAGIPILDAYHLSTRPPSMSFPSFAEKAVERDDDNADNAYFEEKFFPQDVNPPVLQKSWQRAIENAYNQPREETVVDFPTRADHDDLNGISIPKKMREMELEHVARTIPVSQEKQHEVPVEPIQTGGGERRGFHPLGRYHKFLLSDNELLDLAPGPQGAAGPGKSSRSSDLDNTKAELTLHHVGVPTSTFFHPEGIEHSFQLDPSNAESWKLTDHIAAGQRGPVEKTSGAIKNEFFVAHDDGIDTLSATYNSGLSKPISRSSNTSSASESTLKNAEVATPSFTGALGGNRHSSISKDSLIKTKTAKETISQGSSSIAFTTGSSSSNKNAVLSSIHTDADERFAEQDTISVNKRKGSARSKAVDIGGDFTTNNDRENINEKQFTSLNHLAPTNKSLPPHIRVAPTASVTALQNMVLKGEDDSIQGDVLGSGPRRMMSEKGIRSNPEKESTMNESRLSTILNDRMNLARQGAAPKMPANPYMV